MEMSQENLPPSGDYNSDREWSDKFLPQVKQIVGPMLLIPSDLEEDRKHATDLIILKARDMRVAVRLRRSGYLKYGNQFTFRYKRNNGVETEWSKIKNGFADWFLYGHVDSGSIVKWMVIDLHKFRECMKSIKEQKNSVWGIKSNHDNKTHFIWFDADKIPEVVIAKNN